MPNGETQYVTIEGDKTPHVLAEGSVKTACYLDVPYNSPWTTDLPDNLCDECADKAGIEKPKAAKKSSGSKAT